MTRKGRILVPATVPFWLKPFSTFGLVSLTMFIERSPGFAIPSILAPLRLRADRDIGPSRLRCQPVGCGSIVRRRCTSRYLHWVGSGRVTLWHVSPIPPLDPYVRLSPHTAHERRILWEMSISPAPRSIHRGQLCAFAGYLCTVSLPSPSGPSPCTRLSRAPTPMPYLTAWRALEFRWALACLLSTLLHIPSRLSRVQSIGLKAECCRWRVSPCPFHSLWLPRHSMG